MNKYARSILRKLVKKHDYTWEYADDHRYWKKGLQERATIRAAIDNANCPFTYEQLCSWARGFHDQLPSEQIKRISEAYSNDSVLEHKLFLAINDWLRTDTQETTTP